MTDVVRVRERKRGLVTAVVTAAMVTVVVVFLAGCEAPPPPARPRTALVERGTVSSPVSGSGSLAAVSEVRLRFPAPAMLSGIAVRVGDSVRPGQLLAWQDTSGIVDTLHRTWWAWSDLLEQLNPVAYTPLQAIDADGEWIPTSGQVDPGQRAALTALQVELFDVIHDVDGMILYAPVGGVVSRITAAPGQNVGGPDAVITLSNVNSYRVAVPLQQPDASKVRQNQDVELTFDGLPGLRLPGQVVSLDPSTTPGTELGAREATIVLEHTDPRLSTGQRTTARVISKSPAGMLVIPNSAVIKEGDKFWVTLIGRHRQPIVQQFAPGAIGQDNTQVLAGLSAGQEIVVK